MHQLLVWAVSYGILAESKYFVVAPYDIFRLTKSRISNEVQNFLYLSKAFNSSHATESISPALIFLYDAKSGY